MSSQIDDILFSNFPKFIESSFQELLTRYHQNKNYLSSTTNKGSFNTSIWSIIYEFIIRSFKMLKGFKLDQKRICGNKILKELNSKMDTIRRFRYTVDDIEKRVLCILLPLSVVASKREVGDLKNEEILFFENSRNILKKIRKRHNE